MQSGSDSASFTAASALDQQSYDINTFDSLVTCLSYVLISCVLTALLLIYIDSVQNIKAKLCRPQIPHHATQCRCAFLLRKSVLPRILLCFRLFFSTLHLDGDDARRPPDTINIANKTVQRQLRRLTHGAPTLALAFHKCLRLGAPVHFCLPVTGLGLGR